MQRFSSLFGLLWGLWLVLFAGPVWAGYVNNGDGTVSDTTTGLMWQQETPNDTKTWAQALLLRFKILLWREVLGSSRVG